MTTSPRPATGSPILEVRGVTKEFSGGVRALDGVDLAVYRGETVALIGESGCGKTTLLRLFNRMTVPDRGTVSVDGQDLAAADPIALRRGMGYVQQVGGLLPHWTVARNVELVPRLLGWSADRRHQRTREVLEDVQMPFGRYGDRLPSELSGGQRQRIALARALAADPAIILLDEPFGALDAMTRRDLQRHFAHLQRGLKTTMVLVTHDLDEAFLLADRIAVMHRGRLLRVASPGELETDAGDPVVARLLELRRPQRSPS